MTIARAGVLIYGRVGPVCSHRYAVEDVKFALKCGAPFKWLAQRSRASLSGRQEAGTRAWQDSGPCQWRMYALAGPLPALVLLLLLLLASGTGVAERWPQAT
jgi:hypothetical protein